MNVAARVEGFAFGDGLGVQNDSAVARYAPDGTLEWLVALEGDGDQYAMDVALDRDGSLLVAGATFGSPIRFTDRDGVVTERGTSGGFLLRLDVDGRIR